MTPERSAAPSGWQRARTAWGLPDLAGRGRFVTANLIDSLGNGLVVAFTVVFFATTTSLPLVDIGAALTVGQLLVLPLPPLIGRLLDRFGPRVVVAVGNWVSAVGFVGFLFSHAVWQIVLWQVVVQLGSTAFWMGNSPLTVAVARGAERARWFGFVRALRNVGVGFGGAASAVALSIGTVTGLRAVMVANVVTFAVAGWLVITLRGTDPDRAAGAARTGAASGGYLTVLRDTRYMRLVLTNVVFVFGSMVISVLLAVYAVEDLGIGSWIVGVLVVLNTAMVALLQTVASRWIETRGPARVLALALLVDAVAFVVFGALLVLPGWAVFAGLLVAIVLFTAAEILSSPPTSELSVMMAPEHLRGRYLGVYQMSWSVGSALAPVLFTGLLEGGAVLPWVFLTAISLLAVPLVIGLDRRPAAVAGETAPAGGGAAT